MRMTSVRIFGGEKSITHPSKRQDRCWIGGFNRSEMHLDRGEKDGSARALNTCGTLGGCISAKPFFCSSGRSIVYGIAGQRSGMAAPHVAAEAICVPVGRTLQCRPRVRRLAYRISNVELLDSQYSPRWRGIWRRSGLSRSTRSCDPTPAPAKADTISTSATF